MRLIRVFLILLICGSILIGCGSKNIDQYGRIESYGYVTIGETPIFESYLASKIVGTLPKYYSFHVPIEDLQIENGLLHVRYDTGGDKSMYPNGWVELNNVKLFQVWKGPKADGAVQKEISHHPFPLVAAKATHYIAEFDKSMDAWSEEYKKAIKTRTVKIGMTSEMVLLAIGFPDKVNRTQGNNAVEQQWIYVHSQGQNHYVYFNNNKVVNLQVVGENQ